MKKTFLRQLKAMARRVLVHADSDDATASEVSQQSRRGRRKKAELTYYASDLQ